MTLGPHKREGRGSVRREVTTAAGSLLALKVGGARSQGGGWPLESGKPQGVILPAASGRGPGDSLVFSQGDPFLTVQ